MGMFRRVAFTVSMLPLSMAAAAETGFGERSMDDDFLEFCEDRGRGAYGRLKCSAFGGGKLSFGGRWRGRFEWSDPYDYGRGRRGEDGTWLHRLLVHADWRRGDYLRVYAELGNHLQRGRPGGPRTTDRDAADITQGFVDLSHPAGAGRLTWRLGRQEVPFGANRLIAPREAANIRLSFDGAVALWRHGSWLVRGIAIKPTAVTDGGFDNRTDHGQRIWGFYAEGRPAAWAGWRLDAYALGFHNASTTLAATTGRERRSTLGLRLSGKRGAWDVDNEIIVQRGRLGRSDAHGWALFTNQGYTFDAPWQPRLGLRADYASGDRRPGDGRVGSFRPLSGPANYISEANTNLVVNLIDVYPSLRIRPLKDLSLSVGYVGLWRASRRDAFYGSGLAVLAPGNVSSARHIGAYQRFSADWRVNPYLQLRLDLTRFDPGAFAKAGGLAAGTYAVAMVDLRF